jgi:hypothetical protein
MTMHCEELLRGLRRPSAPAGLRERVLAAARAARAASAPRSLPERVLGCRPLRLAWGVTAVLLLAANLVLATLAERAPAEALDHWLGGGDPFVAMLVAAPAPEPKASGVEALLEQLQALGALEEDNAVVRRGRDGRGAGPGGAV